MKQKRIVIVNDGTFKASDREHYLAFCNSLKDLLERVKMLDEKRRKTDSPATIVTVVESTNEARDLAAALKVDMVIFVSAKMYSKATELQIDFPELQILNSVGRPVKNKPYLIPSELLTAEGIERMVLET